MSEQAADIRGKLGKGDERTLDEYLDSVRAVENPARVSDLLRTVSERMDVEAKGFGESRRTLDELTS